MATPMVTHSKRTTRFCRVTQCGYPRGSVAVAGTACLGCGVCTRVAHGEAMADARRAARVRRHVMRPILRESDPA